MMNEEIGRCAISYAIQIPTALTLLAGVVLALVFWRRHPMVSLFALIAFAVVLGDILVGPALSVGLSQLLMRTDADAHRFEIAWTALAAVRNLVLACTWGLMVVCVFGWRGGKK